MAREYRLKRRAELQDQTRLRIIEATIELHQTVGSAATTVTDVAERAGVGRATVYRHFPDEPSLSRACSGLYFQRHPAPDPTEWESIEDPRARLQTALEQTYAYHHATQAMISRALADARDHPVMRPYHDHWRQAAEILTTPWHARGGKRIQLRATILLALTFDTWRTLTTDSGLTTPQAVRLSSRLVELAATAPVPPRHQRPP